MVAILPVAVNPSIHLPSYSARFRSAHASSSRAASVGDRDIDIGTPIARFDQQQIRPLPGIGSQNLTRYLVVPRDANGFEIGPEDIAHLGVTLVPVASVIRTIETAVNQKVGSG